MTTEGQNGKSIPENLKHAEALPIAATGSSGSAADRAALFCKVKFVRQEIEHWELFMIEARGVREAIAEFRRRDADLLRPIPKGVAK